MDYYPGSIRNLIRTLARLPGIGSKTAERLAMHILQQPAEEAHQLARSIVDLKKRLRLCSRCFSLSDDALCRICRDPSRETGLICVVEQPADMASIEKSGAFQRAIPYSGGLPFPHGWHRTRRYPNRGTDPPGAKKKPSVRSFWPPAPMSRGSPRRLTLPNSAPLPVKVSRIASGRAHGWRFEICGSGHPEAGHGESTWDLKIRRCGTVCLYPVRRLLQRLWRHLPDRGGYCRDRPLYRCFNPASDGPLHLQVRADG
jgi:hypothetical protein